MTSRTRFNKTIKKRRLSSLRSKNLLRKFLFDAHYDYSNFLLYEKECSEYGHSFCSILCIPAN